jgi:hypothetical protein
MPDLYLDELREELKEECGVSINLSTIWRTLVRSGYTMKKVWVCLIYAILFLLNKTPAAFSSCD